MWLAAAHLPHCTQGGHHSHRSGKCLNHPGQTGTLFGPIFGLTSLVLPGGGQFDRTAAWIPWKTGQACQRQLMCRARWFRNNSWRWWRCWKGRADTRRHVLRQRGGVWATRMLPWIQYTNAIQGKRCLMRGKERREERERGRHWDGVDQYLRSVVGETNFLERRVRNTERRGIYLGLEFCMYWVALPESNTFCSITR